MTVPEVIRWIEEVHGIEGVSLSGGEPFDQAPGLAKVAAAARNLGLGVLIFTGYCWGELEQGQYPGWPALIDQSDLLVAGPYEQENLGTHPLLASVNQELVFLTDRYSNCEFGSTRRLEFRIGSDGTVRRSGLGTGR